MRIGTIANNVLHHIRESWALDYRSLALFRIMLALVVMADLSQRLGFAKALYSDTGVYPRIHAIPFIADGRWSINFINGSPAFASFVIIAGLIAAGCVLVGWRTRIATIVLWVVVVSLHSRNPLVTYGGDDLIRMALFWAMFLPLGRVWSFDSRAESSPIRASTFSLATFGLLTQNAFLYIFTALLKDGVAWREFHNATYYALGMRDLNTGLGDWLFHHAPSEFFSVMTMGTLWIEFTVPLMLLVPVRSPLLRMAAVVLVVALHLGIASTMSVGLFPAISIACIVAVLPTRFWTYLEKSALAKWLGGSRLASLSKRVLPRSVAVGQPTRGSSVADVSTRTPRGLATGFVLNAVCLLAIVLGFMWNLTSVTTYGIPIPAARVAAAGNVFQSWGMFAPVPRSTTVWFLIEGELVSGERIDLLEPIITDDFTLKNPVVLDQRDDVWLRNEPWRKYLERLEGDENQPVYLAGYACRMWNREDRADQRLDRVTITVASSVTLQDGQRAEPVYLEIGSWQCS